jgi:hypothetical protein
MQELYLACELRPTTQPDERAAAYHLVRQHLIDDPTNVPAWLEMSRLVDDLNHQRECLERALALDPGSVPARAAIEQLRLRQMLAPSRGLVGSAAPRKLGAYLVEQGLLTSGQIDEALWEQRQRRKRGDFIRLGDILLQHGWLTPRALARVLVAQQTLLRKTPRFLGEYLLAEGVITSLQLEAALEEQARLRLEGRQVPLGILLVRGGAITLDLLKDILIRQETCASESDDDWHGGAKRTT